MKNAYGYTPLLLAVQNGNINIAKNLIAQGVHVNDLLPNAINALVIAIMNDHKELALYLLNATNIDVQNKNSIKNTALHYATTLSMQEVAKKIIEKGANLNVARDEDGFYPLHISTWTE